MPLSNFGFVASVNGANLFRAAQPAGGDFNTLKSIGINGIFRLNDDGLPLEAEIAAMTGGKVFYSPLPTFTVSKEQILTTVRQLRAALEQGTNVLLHCTHGRDRTGAVVGAYRLLYNGWTLKQVEVERKEYGVNCFVYIADYDIQRVLEQIAGDPK